MSWNYRVCTKEIDKQRIFVILPVYYDFNGKAKSFGEQWQQYITETEGELKDDLQRRELAFERDIINLDRFPEVYLP